MKSLFRLFVLALVVGGWALALAAVHVVRVKGGPVESLGSIEVIPKDHLTYQETFTDVRDWTDADRAAHPQLVARLTELNRTDLLATGKTVEPKAAEKVTNKVEKSLPGPDYRGTPDAPVPSSP